MRSKQDDQLVWGSRKSCFIPSFWW